MNNVPKKARILVVDDDVGMCETLSDILDTKGYEVVTANNGYQAVEKVAEGDVDLVLMDIRMPGMNGVDACKTMKTEKPDLKVILMTAFTVEVLVAKAMKEHDVQVLSKPLDIEMVLNVLQDSTRV